MEYDPLSPPTRRARRSLIAVASVSILAKLFCARIESLPIGGVSLKFAAEFVDFTLLAALIYLTILLGIYVRVDQIPVQ